MIIRYINFIELLSDDPDYIEESKENKNDDNWNMDITLLKLPIAFPIIANDVESPYYEDLHTNIKLSH